MFSSVPMSRMRIVVLDRDKRSVLQELGRLGVMHLAHEATGPDSAPLAPLEHGEDRERCERMLHQIGDLRAALNLPAPAPEAASTERGDTPAGEGWTLDRIEERLAGFDASLAALTARTQSARTRRDQLAAVVEQMTSFKDVDLPFNDLDRFSFLHFAIGSLPEANLAPLRDTVADNVALIPLPREGARRALVAVSSRTGRFALETALQQAGFQRETVSASDGAAVALLLQEAGAELARQDEQLEQLRLARIGLASSLAQEMRDLERCVVMERRLLEAEATLPRTSLTVLITGWVPAADAPDIARRIRERTQGNCVVEIESPDQVPDDQIPILLRHSGLLRPFEMLVAGYGLPGYREIEPTLFVALTYLLMFGMMFGDVGHGAVLALGGGGALWIGKSRKVRDVGTLLLLAGVSSIVFGVVYGSYFGLSRMHHFALWHDPLEGNVLDLMKAAMMLGVGVISIGVILNTVNRFRKGDWLGGFLDSYGVAGAIFYWGVLGLLLKYAALRDRGLTGLAIVLVVGVPLVAWALREPLRHALNRRGKRHSESGNYLEAALESVVEAFEAILSYMANTISFVRLAAYAMSHAAVLMATFVMAREVGKMPVGGGVLSVIVIIAGNAVAITLEGVIAAVQALRLEYYEFFNKFFAGSGRAFTPFRLK